MTIERILEFSGNHLVLVLALVGVALALIITELRRLRSGVQSLEPSAATQLYNREEAVFVDIRPEADFRKAHLPGAISLPEADLSSRLDNLKRYEQRPLVLYCNNGMRSARAAGQIRQAGHARVYELKGGLAAWQTAGYPLEGK